MRRFHQKLLYPLRNGGWGVQMVCNYMPLYEAMELVDALNKAEVKGSAGRGRHKSGRPGEITQCFEIFLTFRLKDATKENAPKIAEQAIKDAQELIASKGGDDG